jgi:signal transduction histidine kinase
MLLQERAGPMTEQQRRFLQEVEKSCAKLAGLVAEMSDLGNLEADTAKFNKTQVDVRSVLSDAIAGLPELPEREVAVSLTTGGGAASVHGDAARLKNAFAALLTALRRELVTSNELVVREEVRPHDGAPASWIAIGDPTQIETLAAATSSSLTLFDEWRGGSGLSLTIARRVLNAHGGGVWAPPDGAKAGAVVILPHSPS